MKCRTTHAEFSPSPGIVPRESCGGEGISTQSRRLQTDGNLDNFLAFGGDERDAVTTKVIARAASTGYDSRGGRSLISIAVFERAMVLREIISGSRLETLYVD